MSATATTELSSKLFLVKTLLEYRAERYWQDFLAGRSIASGIAYETQLQACQLDETLASLQRLDVFISQWRRDITKARVDEATVLADANYKNLLLFLAFYAGRVLAKQWQHSAQWYGQLELSEYYPNLHVTDDFYQHMAVAYKAQTTEDELFFVLEPIGLRLFGNIDRQFIALQGGQVASGLYQAVSARLPANNSLNKKEIESNNKQNDDNKTALKTAVTIETAIEPVAIKQAAIKPETIKPEFIMPAALEPIPIKSAPISPTPEMFTQLLSELDTIEVSQLAGNDDYRQACKVLDQFERHIAKQQKPRHQVQFSQSHQTARQQALNLLKKSASAGNTAAMLRLAMYELLGEGLIADKLAAEETGAELVKQTANASDSRAQRLLSRMYCQGLGITQDIDSGKIWLEQAAKNGHEEAATVVAQWQQAQMLMTSQKQEQHSMKRYQLLIAAVMVVALLLIIFIK